MRIGVYSDLHVSRTSSILPLYTGDRYTTRLGMIIDTGKWMYKEFEDNNVDLIINCGDTFDSSIVKSDEISAISEFYSCSNCTEEIHIVGNHEIGNYGSMFYSTAILSNFGFIRLIDRPTKMGRLSFLPYAKPEDIDDRTIESISNMILFSHIDILGSTLRGSYVLNTGVDQRILYDNFKVTVNGHLHTREVLKDYKSESTIYNIGSISSMSFVDSNEYIPGISIIDIDDDSFSVRHIDNPHAILFRKINAKSVNDVIKFISTFDNIHRYVLSVSCPYTIRDSVKEFVSSISNIISSRVIVNDYNREVPDDGEVRNDSKRTINSIDDEFIRFIEDNGYNTFGSIDKYREIIRKGV